MCSILCASSRPMRKKHTVEPNIMLILVHHLPGRIANIYKDTNKLRYIMVPQPLCCSCWDLNHQLSQNKTFQTKYIMKSNKYLRSGDRKKKTWEVATCMFDHFPWRINLWALNKSLTNSSRGKYLCLNLLSWFAAFVLLVFFIE
jgi:hypothetical protein